MTQKAYSSSHDNAVERCSYSFWATFELHASPIRRARRFARLDGPISDPTIKQLAAADVLQLC